MSGRYDIAIVGGGVAGSALGGVLAAAGYGVVIVERERLFRDRVRGEGIHPWGVAEAKRLGLLPVLKAAGANELPNWQSYTDRLPNPPYRWADDSIEGLPELAVSHPCLQETMLQWAVTCGAEVVRPARVLNLRPGPELVLAEPDGEVTVRARLVVGADGRRSTVRKWIGTTTRRDPVHHRIGGGLFDRVELDAQATHEAKLPGGRLLLMPQGGGRARIYFICSSDCLKSCEADGSPSAFLAACAPHLPEGALAKSVVAGPVAFFPNADDWPNQLADRDVVLIGDAAGANDPSVGHGLSLVFRDVRELSERLREHRDWSEAIGAFAAQRRAYYEVLRAHAMWVGILVTEEGPGADARREQVAFARELDPTAGGFALIFARGPDGLTATAENRRRFFGTTGIPEDTARRQEP